MKIITEEDLREFVDPDGDKLITIRKARKKDMDALASLILKQAGHIDLNDPTQINGSIDPAELNLFRFKRVARKMIIGGQELTGEEMVQAYLNADPATGEWIDKCIAEVWEGPSEGN